MKIIDEIENLDFHYEIAQRQRRIYNKQKTLLSENTILIELDWKQKIIIGSLFFF